METEICGELRVGDLIKWTYKYDPNFKHLNKNMYSYLEHRVVPNFISILLFCDKIKYCWLCEGKIYSSFWVDDYFKARL